MRTRTKEELEEISRKMVEVTTRLRLSPAESATVINSALAQVIRANTGGDKIRAARVARAGAEILAKEFLCG